MKCSDISARLVDFLYEEIPPAERAEFSAHLAACPSCAAEVKASSRALQRTRTALRGPLNEDPPARAHANILAAARAAAQPARKPRATEKEGFFARLWKAPWLIPAMGAAGVATAVFLIKVIKNPEVLPVREAENPAMVAKPQPTESEALKPAPAPVEQQAEAEAKQATPKEEPRGNAGGKRERAASGAAPGRPASRGPGMSVRKKSIDHDLLMDLDVRAAPTPPEPVPSRNAAPSPKPAATARPLNAPGVWAEPPPPRGQGGVKDHKADVDDLPTKEGSSGAGAGPRGELLQARPQKSAEAHRPAPPASAFALPPTPSAAPAKAAPAPGEFHARAKKAAEAEKLAADERDMQDDLGESAPLRSTSAAKEAEHVDRKGSTSKDSFEERVRKADKLYGEGQWAEAAVAYRALLTQAPNHPSAPVWRQRLMVAEDAKSGKKLIKTKSKGSDGAHDGR